MNLKIIVQLGPCLGILRMHTYCQCEKWIIGIWPVLLFCATLVLAHRISVRYSLPLYILINLLVVVVVVDSLNIVLKKSLTLCAPGFCNAVSAMQLLQSG